MSSVGEDAPVKKPAAAADDDFGTDSDDEDKKALKEQEKQVAAFAQQMLEKAHENDKQAKKELDEKLEKYTNKDKQQGALWENVKEFSKPTSFVVLGFIMAFFIGCIIPSYGFILPRLMYSMVLPADKIMAETNFWALLMFLAAVLYGILSFVMKYSFSRVGSNIGKNCQEILYKSLVTKDLGWHDYTENSAGIMTVVLSKDCGLIEGAATEGSAMSLQTMFAMLISIGAAFYYSWRLALFSFAFVPVMILGSVMQMKYDPVIGEHVKEQDAQTKADLIVSDCIMNYRTVQSFGSDDIVMEEYEEALNESRQSFVKLQMKAGFWFGYGMGSMNFVLGGLQLIQAWLAMRDPL